MSNQMMQLSDQLRILEGDEFMKSFYGLIPVDEEQESRHDQVVPDISIHQHRQRANGPRTTITTTRVDRRHNIDSSRGDQVVPYLQYQLLSTRQDQVVPDVSHLQRRPTSRAPGYQQRLLPPDLIGDPHSRSLVPRRPLVIPSADDIQAGTHLIQLRAQNSDRWRIHYSGGGGLLVQGNPPTPSQIQVQEHLRQLYSQSTADAVPPGPNTNQQQYDPHGLQNQQVVPQLDQDNQDSNTNHDPKKAKKTKE